MSLVSIYMDCHVPSLSLKKHKIIRHLSITWLLSITFHIYNDKYKDMHKSWIRFSQLFNVAAIEVTLAMIDSDKNITAKLFGIMVGTHIR